MFNCRVIACPASVGMFFFEVAAGFAGMLLETRYSKIKDHPFGVQPRRTSRRAEQSGLFAPQSRRDSST